jgi:sec-independent protein translocase protein TatA
MSILAILGLGPAELAVIAVLGLLFFGTRLPKLARSLGQSVNEFKGGLREAKDEGAPGEANSGSTGASNDSEAKPKETADA